MNTGQRKVLGLPTASYQEHKVRKFILDYVYKLDQAGEFEYYQDNKGNVYVTKGVPPSGKYYPCFAAHMDGAREFIKNKIVVYINSIFFCSYGRFYNLSSYI